MSVAAKLVQVMEKVSVLTKDGQMKGGGNYRFLSEEKTVKELHDAFTEVGLAIVPLNMEILENRQYTTSGGANMSAARVAVTYLLMDPEDGDKQPVMAIGEGADSGDKVITKCMTSAYKYALRQCCMISTGDDPESLSSGSTDSQPRRRQGSQQQQGASQPIAPLMQTRVTNALNAAFGDNETKKAALIQEVAGSIVEISALSLKAAQEIINRANALSK